MMKFAGGERTLALKNRTPPTTSAGGVQYV
jgi:hypothetical protein